MRVLAGLLWLGILCAVSAQAQRTRHGALRGTVIDSASQKPIEAATVSVLLIADSSLINYALTNRKGEFTLRDIPQGKPCRVIVSFSGLRSWWQEFTMPVYTKELTLPPIQLSKAFTELEEVIVSARKSPVSFRKDTLEFDANAFRNMPNTVLEELLKNLPGVEVDAQGNITVNGKPVAKITINGRDIFGSDYKITSKSFPSDIIDKIQVADFRSKEDLFNNIRRGNEGKVINITLQKDKSKGVFGRAMAGAGTEERYEGGASLNALQGPLMATLVGFANNTNKLGFSGNDFTSSKSSGNLTGEGSGFTDAKGIGLNLSNQFNPKLMVTGSYFFNTLREYGNTSTRRQNFLPDTSFLYYSESSRNHKSDDHRANLNVDYRLDSMTSMHINGIFNAANTETVNYTDARATSMADKLINTAVNTLANRNSNSNGSIGMFIGRRLAKPGRTVSLSLNYSGGGNTLTDGNRGYTAFYQPDGSQVGDTIDQQGNTRGNNKGWSVGASWAEPVSSSLSMLVRYNYAEGRGRSDRLMHRFNPLTGRYDWVDTAYSNLLTTRSRTHMPEWSVNYVKDKWTVLLGTSVQLLEQSNISDKLSNVLPQRYTNFFPMANIRYQFSPGGSMNVRYEGRSEQPSIDLLQQVPDNSNPLYIRLGNPGLRPSFYHTVNLNVDRQQSRSSWSVGLDGSRVQNQVVFDTWVDSVQHSRPVNTNGNSRVGYSVNYSRHWRGKGWSFRISTSNYGGFDRSVAYANKVENVVQNYSIAQRVSVGLNLNKLLSVTPSVIVRYNNTRYTGVTGLAAENTVRYFTLNVSLFWPKRMVWENDVRYFSNSNTAPGFPQGVTMWHTAVNYQLGKHRRAMVRLAVYDLLRQTTSVSRSVTPVFIEDMRVQALQQYGILSVIYNLAQMGK